MGPTEKRSHIDRSQYSILVTVVVLTALIPTLLAQLVFHPHITALRWGADEEALVDAEPYQEVF